MFAVRAVDELLGAAPPRSSFPIESCRFLAEQGNISREGLRCLAASGIAVAGLFIGEGVGEGLAAAIARKYLAAGAFGCLSTFL